MRRFGAKPSRRRCPELVEGFSRTTNIHCSNLRDVALAVVVRRVESLPVLPVLTVLVRAFLAGRARAGECKRQIEGLFQGLLHEAFRG